MSHIPHLDPDIERHWQRIREDMARMMAKAHERKAP